MHTLHVRAIGSQNNNSDSNINKAINTSIVARKCMHHSLSPVMEEWMKAWDQHRGAGVSLTLTRFHEIIMNEILMKTDLGRRTFYNYARVDGITKRTPIGSHVGPRCGI